MLFNIYLATTVASITIDFIKSFATRKNLLKKGYVFSKEQKDANLFSTILNIVTPGLNVYNAYKLLTGDEKRVEEELLRRGTIKKVEEKGTTLGASTSMDIEKRDITKSRSYEEMTVTEKIALLQAEKESLLNDLSETEKKIAVLRGQK